MKKMVILDRDGVINEDSDAFIKSVDEWIPLPGSFDAIARLSRAGFTVVVATNQSGLGRGLFTEQALEDMHERLRQGVNEAGGQLGKIYHCPHKPDDGCSCRKPAAGLLDAIARDYDVDLTGVPIVGDSLRDLQAGLVHHCLPILVRTGKGRRTEADLASTPLKDALVVDDLAAAADWILEHDAR